MFEYMKNEDGYTLTDDMTVKTGYEPGFTVFGQNLRITSDGYLKLKCGYRWDGASFLAVDTKTNLRASALHDAFCTLHNECKIPFHARRMGDRLYRDVCLEDGMFWFRAAYQYLAVSAWSYYRKLFSKYNELPMVPKS